MLFLAIMVAIIVAAVPLRGGSLGRLSTFRLRWHGLLALSAAAQVLILSIADDRLPHAVAAVLHVASFLPAGAVVWANRRVRGIVVCGVGGALNLAAIAANGGVMPASRWATVAAGRALTQEGFRNSAPIEGAHLWWLGDVLVWPAPLPGATPFSVGDVLLLAGFALALHAVCRPASNLEAELLHQ